MAKNFATTYAFTGDSIALNQKLFLKIETTKGTLIAPGNTDHFLHIGGSLAFTQPNESSPHKTGRHNNNTIRNKKILTWAFQTFINIDTTQGSPGVAEVDDAIEALWQSVFGLKTISSGVVFTPTAPDITMTILNNGDKWAEQAMGCFAQGANLHLPGDGRATIEWTGAGKEVFRVGIGKSTTNNSAGNTVTVLTGEGKRFRVGALVMIIKANGTTRSTDTAAGSARTVSSVTGDVVTLSGAVLADADGSSTPVYLAYYEPSAPSAIDNPQTGLVGTFSVAGLSTTPCARQIGFNFQNNHELVNYCYGHDALDSPFFVAGSRFSCEVTMEMNLNDTILTLLNDVQDFTAQDLTAVLGSASSRYLQVLTPRVIFQLPEVSVPETGSIPVTFTGMAYQTSLDAGDEVTLSYK